MSQINGTLKISVKSAIISKSVKDLDKRKTFIQLTLDQEQKVTNFIQGGYNPKYNQTLEFNYENQKECKFEALIQGKKGNHDLIGSQQKKLSEILDIQNKKISSVEFLKGKEMIMELIIQTEYVPPLKLPTQKDEDKNDLKIHYLGVNYFSDAQQGKNCSLRIKVDDQEFFSQIKKVNKQNQLIWGDILEYKNFDDNQEIEIELIVENEDGIGKQKIQILGNVIFPIIYLKEGKDKIARILKDKDGQEIGEIEFESEYNGRPDVELPQREERRKIKQEEKEKDKKKKKTIKKKNVQDEDEENQAEKELQAEQEKKQEEIKKQQLIQEEQRKQKEAEDLENQKKKQNSNQDDQEQQDPIQKQLFSYEFEESDNDQLNKKKKKKKKIVVDNDEEQNNSDQRPEKKENQDLQINQSFIFDESINQSQFNLNDTIEISQIKSVLKKSMKTKKNEGRFVVFKLEGQELQTQTNGNPEKNVEWVDNLRLLRSQKSNLEIEMWEQAKKGGENTLLGSSEIELEQFLSGGQFEEQRYPIQNENEEQVGEIVFNLKYKKPIKIIKKHPKILKPQLSEDQLRKQVLLEKRKERMKYRPPELDNDSIFLPKIRKSQPSPFKGLWAFQINNNSNFSSVQNLHQKKKKQISIQNSLEDDIYYKDRVSGQGYMSNLQSAFSLQQSVPTFSVPKENRFQGKQYQGLDSFFYNPPSDFTPKDNYKEKLKKYGIGFSKGTSFGKSDRIDFTKPYKDLPGPAKYGPPILKDKFADMGLLNQKRNKINYGLYQ